MAAIAPVQVTFDPALLVQRMQARWKAALPEISARILDDCNRYARDDTGRMIRSSYSASGLAQGRLVWRTAYARRVYYTGSPSHKQNASASLRWCEHAKAIHGQAWRELAAEALANEK